MHASESSSLRYRGATTALAANANNATATAAIPSATFASSTSLPHHQMNSDATNSNSNGNENGIQPSLSPNQQQQQQQQGPSNIDLEGVFFRLHQRLVDTLTYYFSIRFLKVLEALALVQGIFMIGLLIHLHMLYVSQIQSPSMEPNCLTRSIYNQLEPFLKNDSAHIVRIEVNGIWSRLANEDRKSKYEIEKTLAFHTSTLSNNAPVGTVSSGIGGSSISSSSSGNSGRSSGSGDGSNVDSTNKNDEYALIATELYAVWLQDPVYFFSLQRGYLMLDDRLRRQHGIHQANISIQESGECFGGEAIKMLFDNFIGYDVPILNSLLYLYKENGYLYSIHSRTLFSLQYSAGASSSSSLNYDLSELPIRLNENSTSLAARNKKNANQSSLFKIGVLTTTLFLFFITTTLVHHTLRETQQRMLKFTFDLQMYVRRGWPYTTLVLNHVVGSLVFVPIMVGMLFFLFEFFNDQLLAFMVLTVVWMCELYSVVCLRTSTTIDMFPRLFFIYFCSFHLYFFSFPSGFSYLALCATIILLQHAMLAFWIRCEIPALQSGRINARNPREVGTPLLDFIPASQPISEEERLRRAAAENALGGGSLAIRALVSVHEAIAQNAPATNQSALNESTTNNNQQQSNSSISASLPVRSSSVPREPSSNSSNRADSEFSSKNSIVTSYSRDSSPRRSSMSESESLSSPIALDQSNMQQKATQQQQQDVTSYEARLGRGRRRTVHSDPNGDILSSSSSSSSTPTTSTSAAGNNPMKLRRFIPGGGSTIGQNDESVILSRIMSPAVLASPNDGFAINGDDRKKKS